MLRQLNVTLRDLRDSKLRLEEVVEGQKIDLEGLTRFDKRQEVIMDVDAAFDKMTGYIGDFDNKSRKTFALLTKL